MTPAPLRVEASPAGLYAPGLDLHLDPSRPVRRAFVSHAHGDHAGEASEPGGELFASPETAELLRSRFGVAASRVIGWSERIEIVTPIGPASLSIAPAGHVLGAAQLVADTPAGRLVYTGDYQSGPGLTHAPGVPIACDVLVLESTFGLPIFRFPERAEARRRIAGWCADRLSDGDAPVLLAYALGKGQELAAMLAAAGLPVMVHGAIDKVCRAYERLGVPMPGVRPYSKDDKDPAVLLVPPRARGLPMVKKRKRARIGYVSGWALVDAARERFDADEVFPLSDHADFDDLVATARASGASEIFVTHGAPDAFAGILREAGLRATGVEVVAVDERERAREEGPA